MTKLLSIVAGFMLITIMGCTENKPRMDEHSTIQSRITITAGKAPVQKSIIEISENPIVSARITLTSESDSQSASWTTGEEFYYEFSATRLVPYTITVTEKDSSGKTTVNSAVVTPKANYNTVVTVTLGGGITVTSVDPVVSSSCSSMSSDSGTNVTSSSAASEYSDGLVAYYPMNGDTLDYSPNGFHGYSATRNFVADRFGRTGSAYYLNGTLESVITVPNHPALKMTEQKTISIWFKAPNASGKTSAIISKGDGSSQREYGIWQLADDLHILCQSYTASFDLGHLWINTNYQNNWHHAVWTKNNRTMNFYYDSQLIMTYSISEYDTFSSTDYDMLIGYGRIHDYYTGAVDDCRIYNRELSSDEVSALYQAID